MDKVYITETAIVYFRIGFLYTTDTQSLKKKKSYTPRQANTHGQKMTKMSI